MFKNTQELLRQIKEQKPLVLNITNYVTMDFVANGLLSIGASPVMSKAEQEIEDLLQHAKSVVINLGTLNKEFIALCQRTCQIANQLNIPIVLDPVGAGASQFRTETCLALLSSYRIAIIRGNASEVLALAGVSATTKGVDSTSESKDVVEQAKIVSARYHAAVVVSGKTDIIVDGEATDQLDCGSAYMPTITGSGCLLTAVIAAFHALEKNRFIASKIATLFYGICGEAAAITASGPGSFKTQFLDILHLLPESSYYERY